MLTINKKIGLLYTVTVVPRTASTTSEKNELKLILKFAFKNHAICISCV